MIRASWREDELLRPGRRPSSNESDHAALPETKEEADQLDQDLVKMGCGQLQHKTWGLWDVYMVKELKVGAANQFDGTIGAKPNMWTAVQWRKTYGFGAEGSGFCTRKKISLKVGSSDLS